MRLGIKGINKWFGGSQVLHDIDLSVESGELMALLGPSGSGKSTLLRIAGGLEHASSGRVSFGNEDTTGWPVQQRRVGFVFQSYALFKHMTVFENVAFGLRALPRSRRPNAAELRHRVLELLQFVRLEGTERRYPAQLSGGQQQRVALARALAIDPRVLLLDEPFGALDTQVRKELRRWVRQIHDQTRLTSLFVTHDQDEALELADRIAIMQAGRVVQVGTPDQIFDHPVNRFVHQFVGETSTVPVQVHDGRVHFEGGAFALPSDLQGTYADGPADLLFRPQQVDILPDSPQGALATSLVGELRSVLRVGALFRLTLRVGNSQVELEVRERPHGSLGSWVRFRPLRWTLYGRADGMDSVRVQQALPPRGASGSTPVAHRMPVAARI